MGDSARQAALVTGAGNGIGRAVALRLAEAGFDVVATDRDAAALAALPPDPRLRLRTMDVRDGDAVRTIAHEAKRIDVLVNCAGVVQAGTILTATDDDLEFGLDVNFRSMWRTIRAVLPGMVERRSGAIVNVSSIGSSVKGFKDRVVYGATKAAVIGLTKSVAADFAPFGITCNAVCPGPVDSPSMRERLGTAADVVAAQAEMRSRVPIGRMGTPEEVAELVAYLANARFTTGQIHVIDGGVTG